MGGALADPVDGGMLVFSASEAAENFAEADPYVINGIVSDWTVREWSVVVGALPLPPIPHFAASYEWKRVESGQLLPPGLEVQMPLDGGHQRARIPPSWSLRMNVKDTAGFSFTFDANLEVTRSTTVGELRRAAAEHATRSKALGDIPAKHVSLTIDEHELDDTQTAEEIDLFGRSSRLKVAIRAT